MAANVMCRGVAENAQRTVGEPSPQEVHTELARGIFTDGVKAWGYGDAFAAEVDISKGNLSDMMAGARHVQFRHVLALLDNPEAAKVVLGQQCEHAGFFAPKLKTTISLTISEADALADVRRIAGPVWRYFGSELALTRYGVALDLLDVAIDLALKGSR